jgi:hypothetical protein
MLSPHELLISEGLGSDDERLMGKLVEALKKHEGESVKSAYILEFILKNKLLTEDKGNLLDLIEALPDNPLRWSDLLKFIKHSRPDKQNVVDLIYEGNSVLEHNERVMSGRQKYDLEDDQEDGAAYSIDYNKLCDLMVREGWVCEDRSNAAFLLGVVGKINKIDKGSVSEYECIRREICKRHHVIVDCYEIVPDHRVVEWIKEKGFTGSDDLRAIIPHILRGFGEIEFSKRLKIMDLINELGLSFKDSSNAVSFFQNLKEMNSVRGINLKQLFNVIGSVQSAQHRLKWDHSPAYVSISSTEKLADNIGGIIGTIPSCVLFEELFPPVAPAEDGAGAGAGGPRTSTLTAEQIKDLMGVFFTDQPGFFKSHFDFGCNIESKFKLDKMQEKRYAPIYCLPSYGNEMYVAKIVEVDGGKVILFKLNKMEFKRKLIEMGAYFEHDVLK